MTEESERIWDDVIKTENRFHRLRKVWEAETLYTSSLTEIVEHPAYQKIIEMGPDVIPLMIRDMRDRDTWFWCFALEQITGHSPGPEPSEVGEGTGMFAWSSADIRNAWLNWGKEQGYETTEPE